MQGTIRVGHRQHSSGLGFIRSGLVGNYAAGATKLDRFGRTRLRRHLRHFTTCKQSHEPLLLAKHVTLPVWNTLVPKR